MAQISKNILVKGKVQGVYFQVHARDLALKSGIAGQVRNLPDGSVHILAEGEAAAMESFLAWCAVGPSRARVEELVVEEWEVSGFQGFEILR
jgi:acylphosphatase